MKNCAQTHTHTDTNTNTTNTDTNTHTTHLFQYFDTQPSRNLLAYLKSNIIV